MQEGGSKEVYFGCKSLITDITRKGRGTRDKKGGSRGQGNLGPKKSIGKEAPPLI